MQLSLFQWSDFLSAISSHMWSQIHASFSDFLNPRIPYLAVIWHLSTGPTTLLILVLGETKLRICCLETFGTESMWWDPSVCWCHITWTSLPWALPWAMLWPNGGHCTHLLPCRLKHPAGQAFFTFPLLQYIQSVLEICDH